MKKVIFTLMCLFAMLAAGKGLRAQEITITLSPGWTWISIPCTDTLTISEALGSFTPLAGDQIKSQWSSSKYRDGQWRGGVSKFYPGYGYKYYSNREMPVTLTFNAQQPTQQVMVTTDTPQLITGNSAMGGGNVVSNDGTYILVKGLCWAAHENPTTNEDNFLEEGSGVGSFSATMTGLNWSTTYYYRAYAVTPSGTVYGEQQSFTTRDGIPTLTTNDITNITSISATSGGNITDNGGLNVTARGVCWSTSPNPTVSDSHTTNGTGTGSFTSSITCLEINTTYYVRAYATNASGIAYGDEKIFITRDGIPTLSTFDVIDIGYTSAMCGGNITDDGGLAVTARGVCWSTLPNPTLADTYTINGTGIGEFTSSITGLNVNTTYYVRSYASNLLFTTYGDEISFTTLNVSMDTITVMQYNLLAYGNYNTGYADCFESNNNTLLKDESIRTIMNYVKPDILTVNEFGATQSLLTSFLNNNLNINGVDYWQSDNIINYAGSNIINHIFYDSRKFGLKRHIVLQTSPRDTDVYELFLKTPSLDIGDTIKLVCIVAHPKAGQGYQANRRALMQQAMDYVNQYYSNENVLIMGDFNMYGASESGYQLLTQTYINQDVRFIDPVAAIGGVGEWNNNDQFAAFHTQSTRGYSGECFSGGGMDDRFDFILMSDEIDLGTNNLDYVQNSYKAIGNDGNHFNMSIDQNGNTSVPTDVLNALFDGSDHLPVTMKIVVFDNSKK